MSDGRLSFTDGQTRFSGGLMATNLIMYFEYSRDIALLRSTIYPFVRDNALVNATTLLVGTLLRAAS
jgi:hypothetical protein